MKKFIGLIGITLLLVTAGCEVEGPYGGGYGVYGEYGYGYPYYGNAYAYPYYGYHRWAPYDRDHYWDRDWEYHRGHERREHGYRDRD